MAAKEIIVIGGGIVGLASALKMARRFPELSITLLEKESAVGQHQSTHNSGVLHAGLYYKPGSSKAILAVRGIREMVAFCRDHEIPHEICGKLVVATTEAEVARLKTLQERGMQNGLAGLRWMGPEEIREIEPHAAGLAALRVPEEGIVDYAAVCSALFSELGKAGVRIVVSAKVLSAEQRSSRWRVQSSAGEHVADFIVGCAGLYSDKVGELTGERRDVRIVPFRGEYYKIKSTRQHLVRHLIYPVPDPEFPFLGVHFTRLIEGGIEAGPNAVLAFAREGYRKMDINIAELWDAATYKGLWTFLRRHKRTSWDELRRSFSKRLFCESLQKLVPEAQVDDLEPGGAGVRAQAMSPDGTLVQDFHFVERPGALHVLNAPSPAATASLAIGDEIATRVARMLGNAA
jgi:L-2-hydroxyglutarate oxidase